MRVSAFQGIIIGVCIIVALIGLFVFATYTNTGGKDAIGPVVIWGTLPEREIQNSLTLAAQSNDKLKTVSYVEKSAATIVSDLAAAIATESGPDLVLTSQEELYSIARFITPIPSGTLSASTFIDAFIAGAGVYAAKDGYYGVPFLVDPLVLFYNRAILSSSGIAKPPATWESLTGLTPRIAILTSSRQIKRGLIALGSYSNVHNARGILSSLFLQTGAPISLVSVNGTPTANLGVSTADGTPKGQSVLSFYTQFSDPAKISYTWNTSLPDSQQAFLVGDLALYIGYASEARYLREANPNLSFAAALLPQPGTAAMRSVYGRIYAFMVPRGAKNPEGAYQSAAALSNAAEQTIAASATGLAPASLTVLSMAPADPSASVAYAEALYTYGWLSPAPRDTDAVFSSMINNVITGRSTIESALGTAEQSLNALFQQ